jgi:hypothetical protein
MRSRDEGAVALRTSEHDVTWFIANEQGLHDPRRVRRNVDN